MLESFPLTVGYVLKRFPRLSETFVLNEILELERQGHRVEVFSLLTPPQEERHALLTELKARVTYLPSASGLEKLKVHDGLRQESLSFGALLDADADGDPLFNGKSGRDIAALHLKAMAVAVLARQRGVRHLHAHFGSDATTVAQLTGRLTGLPYSFTAHARDIYHTYTTAADDNAMRRAKIAEAAFVATVSEYNRAHLARIAPAHMTRIRCLYNGIDLTRFMPRSTDRQQGLVVAVGRLIDKKGFGDLIAACGLLKRSRPGMRCRIIGDGPLRAQLEAQIDALDLNGRVEITGSIPQERLIGLMREASVAVLPCVVSESGDRDGLPTVLLEAMALALPVVTTTVSGGPEIVVHGKTGILVEPSDPIGLAASIEALLESPAAAAAMGQEGRKRAEGLFCLKRNVGVLAGLFAGGGAPAARPVLEAV